MGLFDIFKSKEQNDNENKRKFSFEAKTTGRAKTTNFGKMAFIW